MAVAGLDCIGYSLCRPVKPSDHHSVTIQSYHHLLSRLWPDFPASVRLRTRTRLVVAECTRPLELGGRGEIAIGLLCP